MVKKSTLHPVYEKKSRVRVATKKTYKGSGLLKGKHVICRTLFYLLKYPMSFALIVIAQVTTIVLVDLWRNGIGSVWLMVKTSVIA
jgi:hypothetical protein